jgi:hypothetical protein
VEAGRARAAPRRRLAAAGLLVACVPAPVLALTLAGPWAWALPASVGLAAGVLVLGALAGPAAAPGIGRDAAFDQVAAAALVAWGAALDAYLVARGFGDEPPMLEPAATVVALAAYVAGSAWSFRAPRELYWRWPLACTAAASAWTAVVLLV